MAGDNNSGPSSKSENYIENQVKNIYDSKLRLQGQRATDVLLEFANLRPGLNVLDLASGSGVPAIDIARIVGSSGHVTATDQSANALDLAKTEAESEGLTNLSFQTTSAQSLPFDDGVFDVVTCRMGMMFFPEPVSALKEVYRVLKRGGKFVSLVQGTEQRSLWQSSLLEPFRKYISVPVPGPTDIHPLRFAEPGSLLETFENAGFEAIQEKYQDVPWPWHGTPEEFWELRKSGGALYPQLIEQVPADQRDQLFKEIIVSISRYYDGAIINFIAGIGTAVGYKP
jgi:ubiquinone/menaquinone biosynthesis C-methylase UbiE